MFLALVGAPALGLAQQPPKSVVLVHGAWADGSSWDKVVPLLQAKGHNVVAVHLPMTTPADDIAATKTTSKNFVPTWLETGHVSMLSKPREVSNVIFEASAAKDTQRAPAAASR